MADLVSTMTTAMMGAQRKADMGGRREKKRDRKMVLFGASRRGKKPAPKKIGY